VKIVLPSELSTMLRDMKAVRECISRDNEERRRCEALAQQRTDPLPHP
jgi:hypothetical protein